jgi:hypothetical protein
MPEDVDLLAVCGRGDGHVNTVHRGDTRTLLVFLCFCYKLHKKTSQELAAQILLSPSSACEFVWVLFLTSSSMWQQLLKNKYLGDKSLTQISRRPGDSHFWSGLMAIKDQFLRWGHFQVRDGKATKFWKDKWLTSRSLSERFPNLFLYSA